MRINESYFHPETATEDDLLTFFVPEEPVENNHAKNKRQERKAISKQRGSTLFDIRSVFILSLSFIIGFYIGYDLIFLSSTEITTKSSSSTSSSPPSKINRLYTLKSKNVLSNRTSTTEMLGHIYKQRKILEKELMKDYGEYYHLFFEENSMRNIFDVTTDSSRNRLIRRMMIKIILSKLDAHADIEFNWVTAGDAAAAGYGNQFSESYTSIIQKTLSKAFDIVGIRFNANNYAMGDEAQGSIPEIALCMEALFGSDIDILSWDFSSSLPSSSIARDDSDKSGKDDDHRSSLWINRAVVHPSKPILFLQDYTSTGRFLNHFNPMETAGISTIFLQLDKLHALKRKLPDAYNTNSKDYEDKLKDDGKRFYVDHSKLPRAIRYFICNGNIEGVRTCPDKDKRFKCETEGHNVCKDWKYKDSTCANTHFRKSYNPGWYVKGRTFLFSSLHIDTYNFFFLSHVYSKNRKSHLLRGKIISVFLLNVLTEALIQIDSALHNTYQGDAMDYRDWKSLLKTLINKDEYDYNLYQYFPPPKLEWNPKSDSGNSNNNHHLKELKLVDEKRSTLFRGRSVCRTTLQSSAMMLGHVKNNNKDNFNYHQHLYQEERDDPSFSFDGGMSFIRLDKPFSITSLSPYPKDTMKPSKKCNDTNVDYHNYVDIKYENKWIGTIFPNATEESMMLHNSRRGSGAKNYDSRKSSLDGKEGFILLCFDTIYNNDDDNKAKQYEKASELLHGKIEIKVNKITVVDLLEMDGCYFLKGLGGYSVWKDMADSNGKWKFKLLFRVFDPNLKIRLRSIITNFES